MSHLPHKIVLRIKWCGAFCTILKVLTCMVKGMRKGANLASQMKVFYNTEEATEKALSCILTRWTYGKSKTERRASTDDRRR